MIVWEGTREAVETWLEVALPHLGGLSRERWSMETASCTGTSTCVCEAARAFFGSSLEVAPESFDAMLLPRSEVSFAVYVSRRQGLSRRELKAAMMQPIWCAKGLTMLQVMALPVRHAGSVQRYMHCKS